jgi:hypothetical protein
MPDLGGPYFHLIFAILVAGAAIVTGQSFLLAVVVLISLGLQPGNGRCSVARP